MRRRSGLSCAPIEFFPRRFYLVVVRERATCSIHRTINEASHSITTSERHLFPRTPGVHFVSLQEHILSSTSSTGDFVLGISQTIRFNSFLTSMLSTVTPPPPAKDPTHRHSDGVGPKNVHYFFLRRRHLREEIQAIHLICRWRLLYLHLPPHEALAPFEHLPYVFSSFLSSSNSFDSPNLLVSLAGISKGLEKELLGPLKSPSNTSEPTWDAITTHTLKHQRVSLVLALNKMHSEASTFTERGLEMLDISSTTTSPSTISHSDKRAPPDDALVSRFLETCEGTEDLIAVIASTYSSFVLAVTCIGCYLMKHSNFTSQEVIGWLQFCLPVKIPMTSELCLGHMQSQMWLEGERFRQVKNNSLCDDISNSRATDSMHINIGKISLGRVSLLGTRDRDKHRIDSYTASIPVTSCLSSRSQGSEHSPTTATTTAQLKRRPLTQGSVGNRRFHRSMDGTNARADFALMHKFLHQTPPSSTRSTPTSANSPASSIHPVPSRPKASSRSPNGTPANCTEALA
ncbi:Dual specificity protein phosphatase [Phytophthora palmivora]|uniref:Dual specificity protein phosphatase n=1 Tax=Phytophthora palmivora TaxID=4796 RepID=A0A2P4Y130_9STRA|nr:Dual specificity protein phosphatase [Phytophthora palmivora]